MRVIIRVIISETTDEKMIEIKKKITTALRDYDNIQIELSKMG